MAVIVEGRKAPSFTLEDGAGKRISLEDFKGKNVVVYFYPKDDTPGCTKEACGVPRPLEGAAARRRRRPRRLR
jgi:thioredoxin-dependent peroxiredoxin